VGWRPIKLNLWIVFERKIAERTTMSGSFFFYTLTRGEGLLTFCFDAEKKYVPQKPVFIPDIVLNAE
jgi:hypothetical protein